MQAQENKPGKPYLAVTILLSLFCLLNISDPQFLHLFKSKHHATFFETLQAISVFLLPIAIFFFYRRNKTAYKTLLFYLPFVILKTMERISIVAAHEVTLPYIPLFNTVLSITVLVLLLLNYFMVAFNVTGRHIATIVLFSIYATTFTITGFDELRFVIMVAPFFFLLFFLPAWDWKLYGSKKSKQEDGTKLKGIYGLKTRITLLPFLSLIPAWLVVQLLEGSWFSDIAVLVMILLPALIANRLLAKECREKPYLKKFVPNFHSTIAFYYFILFVAVLIYGFTHMGGGFFAN